MTNETGPGTRRIFVPAILPWLLGGGMFAVYFLTLYHSASPASLTRLAYINGSNWRPEITAPLTYLATYPIRWLPGHLQLAAINLFAAGCAALVLVLLARSVALLPHDRTNEQRLRAQDEHALLLVPTAWLPPLFAVLVCGLQISFWERSVQFVEVSMFDSGEIFNLLLLAYVIRCLLEFRISERESWLNRCALVFGLGMANNWGMIGFFPLFLMALIWIMGFDFFAWRFVVRMLAFGLAGLCLILLLPALVGSQHFGGTTIWSALRLVLGTDKSWLMGMASFRHWFPVLAVTSFVPAALIGMRWATSFGDNSPLGIFIANTTMSVAYGFLMACCLWVTLDPSFGPRQDIPLTPLLPLFYLGALSVGYFSGYFLLVFGSRPVKQRQRTPPWQKWLNRGIVTLVVLVMGAVPAMLAWHNLSRIRLAENVADATARYYTRIEQALPSRNAVILSDSPEMLFNLEAVQARHKDNRDDIFIDTASVGQYWDYISFLEAKHPQDNIGGVFTDRKTPAPRETDAIHLMENLHGRHDLFYLQPSFGYYFERFYMRPHGLLYALNECSTNEWTPPPIEPAQISENLSFWKGASEDVAFLVHVLQQQPSVPTNVWEQFQESYLFAAESNRAAADLAQLYSRALNYWGVQLQSASTPAKPEALQEAAECFEAAVQLSPDNGPALVNRNFNRDLRAHTKPDTRLLAFEDKLPGTYRYWWDEVRTGGPFDQPGYCGRFSALLRAGNNLRQSIEQLQRVEALMPGDPVPPFVLYQTYMYAPAHEGDLTYAYPSQGAAFFDAAAAADRALRAAPDDTNTLWAVGLSHFQLANYLNGRSNEIDRPYPTAGQAFSNGMAATDRLLLRTDNHPAVITFKAEALMRFDRFNDAIPLLTRLISLQPNNGRFYAGRALAYFRTGRLDDAKGDYEYLIKNDPHLYGAYYGLGEIAYTNKDFPQALKNYQLYLTNAPDSTHQSDEYIAIEKRVSDLKNSRN